MVDSELIDTGAGKPGASNDSVSVPLEMTSWTAAVCRAAATWVGSTPAGSAATRASSAASGPAADGSGGSSHSQCVIPGELFVSASTSWTDAAEAGTARQISIPFASNASVL